MLHDHPSHERLPLKSPTRDGYGDSELFDSPSKSDENKRKQWVFFSFLFPALGGLLFGFDIGCTAQAIPLISNQFILPYNATSHSKYVLLQETTVSLSLIGAFVATLIVFQVGDWMGRRREILLAACLYICGTFVQFISFYADSFALLLVGRVTYGLGIGFCMHAAPLYIAETASADVRGLYISMKEVFIVVGMLYGYVAGFICYHPSSADCLERNCDLDHYGWQFMYLSAILVEVPLLFGIAMLKETPRFLVLKALNESNWNPTKEDFNEAFTVLRRLRSTATQTTKEIDDIIEGLNQQRGGSWSQLRRASFPLLIGTGLVCLQQITGQPSVLYYVNTIFENVFPNGDRSLPFIASVVVGSMKFLATLSSAGLVDKRGRRPLLLIGVGLQTLALLVLAGLFFAYSFQPPFVHTVAPTWAKWFVLVVIMVYVTGYQIGFGPISWLMISEIFPLKIRAKALSIAVVTNFGTNIIVSFTFLNLFHALGGQGLFLLYGCIAVGAWFFIFFLVPETKGKSLEEIEEMFFGERTSHVQLNH